MDGMNKEKWRAMTKEQKREHIWEYYKLPIVGTICVLAVLAWFIYQKATYIEPAMKVVMTDVAEYQNDDSCFHEFLEEYGYEVYDGAVQMNQNLRFYLNEDSYEHLESNGNNYNILFALFAVGDQELMFGGPDVFASCAVEGAMLDLSTVLPAELLEKYEDRLLFTDENGNVEAYPCGVNLAENPWIAEHELYKEGYVGIIKTTDDKDMAADFIEYILNQFDNAEGE